MDIVARHGQVFALPDGGRIRAASLSQGTAFGERVVCRCITVTSNRSLAAPCRLMNAACRQAFLVGGTEGETVANAKRAPQIEWFHLH